MKNFNNISSNEEQSSQATGWENMADYANKEKSLEQIRKENLESLKERGANEKIFESGVLNDNEVFREYLGLDAEQFESKVEVREDGSIEFSKNDYGKLQGENYGNATRERFIANYQYGVNENGKIWSEANEHKTIGRFIVNEERQRELFQEDYYSETRTFFEEDGSVINREVKLESGFLKGGTNFNQGSELALTQKDSDYFQRDYRKNPTYSKIKRIDGIPGMAEISFSQHSKKLGTLVNAHTTLPIRNEYPSDDKNLVVSGRAIGEAWEKEEEKRLSREY